MAARIKGRRLDVDDQEVAVVTGWRDPRGRYHLPYSITGTNGTVRDGWVYATDALQNGPP